MALLWPSALGQLTAIAFGALFGTIRGSVWGAAPVAAGAAPLRLMPGWRAGLALLLVFAALLALLPLAATATGFQALAVFDAFYRAGALVFGGGHVVLPLLQAELVPRQWVTAAWRIPPRAVVLVTVATGLLL